MEHWIAAVVASIVGVVMVAVVIFVSFKLAGPAPRYTFTNQPTVATVATVASLSPPR
ncbi:MAG TPA: hypothetical protein VF218_16370 [Acidothermaceae bacterium]|jgi:hypothetical protein